MISKINGLITRETAYGESDKLFCVLTAERGKLFVTGKGVRSVKSALRHCSHIMFYGELTLYEKGGKLWLKEASPIRDFYDVTLGLEGLSLVAYIFDIVNEICVEETEQGELLRLTLNTLHAVTRKKYGARFIKAVFELRCASEAGYAPDLDGQGCAECGRPDANFLDCVGGRLVCRQCAETLPSVISLLPGTLEAMRYVIGASPTRIYSFHLDGDAEDNFRAVCESYLLAQLERSFRTLEYFNALFIR